MVRATGRHTRHWLSLPSHPAPAQATGGHGRIRGSRNRRARLVAVAKRMVVTGAGGQVGRFLAGQAGRQRLRGARADPPGSRHHRPRRGPPARRGAGDVVVNCAAFTNVDAAEAEPGRGAGDQRASVRRHLARACAGAGARLVHISTDYVFSGRLRRPARRPYEIDDPTGPLEVYGQRKLDGELAVHAVLPDAHVVRTSWVYTGGAGTDFVAVMRRLAAGDRTIDVVDDQTGSPTYVKIWSPRCSRWPPAASGPDSARRQRRCGQPLRSGPRGVRRRRRRPGAGAAGRAPPRSRARRPARCISALSMAASARAGLTPLRRWREALAEALAVPVGDSDRYPRRRERRTGPDCGHGDLLARFASGPVPVLADGGHRPAGAGGDRRQRFHRRRARGGRGALSRHPAAAHRRQPGLRHRGQPRGGHGARPTRSSCWSPTPTWCGRRAASTPCSTPPAAGRGRAAWAR